jgi:lipopolysaccharide transport system permease protein/teichoic acid transport system permease protein
MILTMALHEMQNRYAGTMAGFVWSVVNPLLMLTIYWFVFSVGFKVQPMGNVPFIVVFACGLIPWQMFNDTIMSNVGTIIGNPHLVKKMVFPTEILALVNLIASLISHIIMLIILFIIMFYYGISFSVYNFQFLYYLFAVSVFALGLSWLFSALNVFYRDVGQILSVVISMWFWVTPIVWAMDIVPKDYQFFIKLNPIYYIVEGYKSSFIYHEYFWTHYRVGGYFWAVALASFAVGGFIFKKLKPEFADIL